MIEKIKNPVLKGRGGREIMNGATVRDNSFTHLSTDIGQSTICGHMVDGFMITYADVEITCPKCIKILRSK